MTEKLVGTLAEFGARDLPVAGGKGANLGELVRHGFPVPEGFVVTTAAYTTTLRDSGLDGRLQALLQDPDGQDPDGRNPDAGALRELVSAATVPPEVRSSIAAAYAALGAGPVAVRSSATAEDLPGAAFAGQQDTFLNVIGEREVLDAVVRCWASLWTDRAVAYRQRQGIDPRTVAIAVVVQEMVEPRAAGVMFTANPVTGERGEIVVDAGAGLGEAVVSGLVTPGHYVLDSRGHTLSFTPGGNEVIVRAVAGGGTEEVVPAGPSRADSQPADSQLTDPQLTDPQLTDAELAELARLARRAEELFGRPQDMEWAVADGRIQVLQSRPMTGLPPQPPALSRFQRMVGPFFVEMFQQRPYPLDVSGWMQRGIFAMLGRMAGSVGVVFPSLHQILPEEDGVVLQLVPPVPRPTLRTLAAPVSVARRVRRFKPAEWTRDRRFPDFLAEVERLRGKDPSRLSWTGVLGLARDTFTAMEKITDLRVSYLPGSFVPQAKLRLMLLLLGKSRLAPALVAGAETRTSKANRALEDLAALVRSDAVLSTAFAGFHNGGSRDGGAVALLERVEHDPAFGPFRAGFHAFLAEFGHRETVSVVLSSAPTWSDAPDVVLGLVKALTGERPPAEDQTGAALAELKRHPALRAGAVRRLVLAAVDEAKTGMAFREDSHFYATMVLPLLRRAQLELGRRLSDAGVLDAPGDVYHLRLEELEAVTEVPDGGALPAWVRERYRPLVLARAAKRRELEGIPLLDPAVLFVDGRKAQGALPGALLRGTGASRGQAAGAVRVIHGPEDFGSLRSGEILVCPYTNPSWTPLFQRAAAVVVDAGGLGSHAAIVAREYGIPAVMGTAKGTKVLHDGQRVLVDGSRGEVRAAAGAPSAAGTAS
ncbi:PEP/pyruvate-binding domain-containing protein [Arthrobacter silvisoli]|uniref:PEP/pyruvate-binding domain-containing protein n=1 Tax=Arthrobacter silvisoli TaxID=2291022 RepID=UPI000E217E4A|nr:PEP/pyruvate-binding domain-containing protein [Arthrobacter silvisoli]